MYRVGLTGGIGSGKTTVANLFKKLGITIIDTDLISHQVSSPDGPAYSAIIEQFGPEVLNKDQSIDRRKLAHIIFNSEEKKKILENILHPLIWLIVEQQVQLSQSQYCIIVVPLLFEGDHQQRFDCTLVVDSTETMQISRVKKRDQRSEDEIRSIIQNQIPRQQRLEMADYVIVNNGDMGSLQRQVKTQHETFLAASSSL